MVLSPGNPVWAVSAFLSCRILGELRRRMLGEVRMGVRDWVRRVEDEFFDRLKADPSRQAKYTLVSGILFFVVALGELLIGAVTGSWLWLLLGGLALLAAGFSIRSWRSIRRTSGSPRR